MTSFATNSSGDIRSPSDLVIERLSALRPKSHYGDYTYGQNELQKMLHFLDQNGYEFSNLEESNIQGVMNAIFTKEIKYTDKVGDAIGDREITVTVTIDSDFDWKNKYRDQDGEFDFSTENQEKGETFVKNLTKKTYGGKRKSKKNKTRRS